MTDTTALDLNTWTARNGQTRRYVNNWQQIVGFDVERYNSGNIRYAAIGGREISNRQAALLAQTKVWIDDNDVIHVDNFAAREDKTITPNAIRAAIARLL